MRGAYLPDPSADKEAVLLVRRSWAAIDPSPRPYPLHQLCPLTAGDVSFATSSGSPVTRLVASLAAHVLTTSCSGTPSFLAQLKHRSRMARSSCCSPSTSLTQTSRRPSSSSRACSTQTCTRTASSVSTFCKTAGRPRTTSPPSSRASRVCSTTLTPTALRMRRPRSSTART